MSAFDKDEKKANPKSDALAWVEKSKREQEEKLHEKEPAEVSSSTNNKSSANAAPSSAPAGESGENTNVSVGEKGVEATSSSNLGEKVKGDREKAAEEAAAEKAEEEEAAKKNVDDELSNAFEDALNINAGTKISHEESHLYIGDGFSFRDEKFKAVPTPILDAIEKDLEMTVPSPIQFHTIPKTVEGKSVIAQAQTGSGKTLAFGVALLSRLDLALEQMQALVIAPTRELAIQIIEMAVAGGGKIARGARCKSHVVVGTSGKIKDWSSNSKKYIDFKTLKVLVLDEADMMVKNDGFREDVTSFTSKCRADCQYLFFSATYPDDCETYCKQLAPAAFLVKVPKNNLMVKQIFQVRMKVPKGGKVQMLKHAYDILSVESSIVFLDTVAEADAVSRMLLDEGFTVSTLHGKIDGADRDTIMDAFRRGETKFLVTTDVLSRGVDVPAVSVVVNFTVPRSKADRNSPNLPDSELYLHRIGRTGRYGRRGFAITLIETTMDEVDLEEIEKAYSPTERVTVPCESSFEHIAALKEAISNMSKVQQK
eukprot:GSChrysophyteH1.ASY1.ANO1.2783.1 assembled CDS